jgi:hypothetical protein
VEATAVVTVDLICFGVRFLAKMFPNNRYCQAWSRMRRRDLHQVTAMHVYEEFRTEGHMLDTLIDCRLFRDPHHDGSMRGHIGSHPDIMMGVVNQEAKFRSRLESLCGVIKAINPHSMGSGLRVQGFWCRVWGLGSVHI